MTQDEPPTQETIVPSRTWKAATEPMEVETSGPDFIVKKREDGDRPSYNVFSNGQGCECEDFRWRKPAGGCKHMRRVQMVIGNIRIPTENEIPEGEEIDPWLIVQREKYANKQSLTDTETEKIITDGGTKSGVKTAPLSESISTSSPEPEPEISVNGLLSNLLLPDDGADLDADFFPYCAVVKYSEKTISRLIEEEV